MDELKDCSIHHTTLKICEDLKNTIQYKNVFEEIQVSLWDNEIVTLFVIQIFLQNCIVGDFKKLVTTPNVRVDDFKTSLLKAMQETGLEAELKNNIYRWVKTKKKDSSQFDSFFR